MIDIEPVTGILSLILFGAFTVPFILHSLKNKKIEKALLAKINEVAATRNAKPEQIETWRRLYGIGLDSSKKVLVYLRDDEQSETLDLQDFSKVKLVKTNIDVVGEESTHSVLNYVGLELTPKTNHKLPVVLEFYDGDKFSDLMGETLLADKWEKILKSNLN